MLNKFSASNFQLVELKVPANTSSSRFYFQDQPNLRNKIIEKIEYYDGISVPFAPSGLPNTGLVSAYLTLADGNGNDFIQDINIYELNGIYSKFTNGNPISFNAPFTIKPRNIVFTKSFISLSSVLALPNAYSICFGVYYK